MNQLDLQVVQKARAWFAQGQPVWLCTVLATFSSAPRGPGGMWVCLGSGEHRGSLSGGCVEDDFLERAIGDIFKPVSQIVRYGEGGLAPTLAWSCGGLLDVLVEYLAPTEETGAYLAAVEAAFAGVGLITRRVLMGTEHRGINPASHLF